MSGETNSSTTDVFTQHHEEIRRRHDVTISADQNPTTFERAKDAVVNLPFKIDTQSIAVYSVSHERMAPKAQDPKAPAIRIYGLFPDQDEALDFAKTLSECDPSCSVLMCPTHEWNLLPRSPERLQDPQSIGAHIDRVLKRYANERDESTQRFHDNVKNHRTGDATSKTKKEEDEKTNDHESTKPATKGKRLPRDAEVRGQQFVAVSFLTDTEQSIPEPLFRIYAAFDSTADADSWVRNSGGDEVKDFNIDIVDLGKWLFPNDVPNEKLSKEVYRSSELGNIMQSFKDQPAAVENYRKWREESDPDKNPKPAIKDNEASASGTSS